MTTGRTQQSGNDVAGPAPAVVAKAAIRRLATQRLEPTPENYARAYWQEAGVTPPQPAAAPAAATEVSAGTTPSGLGGKEWSMLIDRLARSLDLGSRYWTTARKKQSLHHVLRGSETDAQRLHVRLTQLLASWDRSPDEQPGGRAPDSLTGELDALAVNAGNGRHSAPMPLDAVAAVNASVPPEVCATVQSLCHALQAACVGEDGADPVARRVLELAQGVAERLVAEQGVATGDPVWAQALTLGAEARRLLSRRGQLVAQLMGLVRQLTDSLSAFSDDDGWIEGQVQIIHAHLDEGVTVRSLRVVGDALGETVRHQRVLLGERRQAAQALRRLIGNLLAQLSVLGGQTGRFETELSTYAARITDADSVESLADVVGELVGATQRVRADVQATTAQMREDEGEANRLQERVQELEGELTRLSREVSTDHLTEVMNRRGLQQAFETEKARATRNGQALAVALLDIDDFKKLNDRLGHQAGDDALRFLAASVKNALRPVDSVARYGGEEFVVLLPETPLPEAQQVLTRLQRALSAQLFESHAGSAFVTFSAGATTHRIGERLEESLDRADEALYEAKRTGKNRTCILP